MKNFDCIPQNNYKIERTMYISIPITGIVKESRKRAEELKQIISQKGYIPVSPYDIKTCKNPTYNDFICDDLKVMMSCDCIFFAKGWEKSCGCNIEHDTAIRLMEYKKKYFEIFYEEN